MWDYLALSEKDMQTDDSGGPLTVQQKLELLGRDDWELVAFHPQGILGVQEAGRTGEGSGSGDRATAGGRASPPRTEGPCILGAAGLLTVPPNGGGNKPASGVSAPPTRVSDRDRG